MKSVWLVLFAGTGSTTDQVGHVIDFMPTCLELAGVKYPQQHAGRPILPLEGKSLAPIFRGQSRQGRRVLGFEHEGGRALIQGDWKLVALAEGRWELYHLGEDATETRSLADREPRRVAEMTAEWRAWAGRVGASAGVAATGEADALPAGPGRR